MSYDVNCLVLFFLFSISVQEVESVISKSYLIFQPHR